MTQFELKAIHGGLSQTSKMPCPSFSLPAEACKTGSKLAQQPGTTCHGCYAMRGNYRFNADRRTKRLELLEHWMENDPALWVQAMVESIGNYTYFRWHDSGDVQSDMHLQMIDEVARALPNTKFWLPTSEVWVSKRQGLSQNLTVRLSATKIDGPPSSSAEHTSTVVTSGHTCPAPSQHNQCGTCRACWDKSIKNVAYKKH